MRKVDVRGPNFKTMRRNFFNFSNLFYSKHTLINQVTNWKSKQLTGGRFQYGLGPWGRKLTHERGGEYFGLIYFKGEFLINQLRSYLEVNTSKTINL